MAQSSFSPRSESHLLPASRDLDFLIGENKADELCSVWIAYDKNSGALHVNITQGYTGEGPTPPPGPSATAPTITVTLPGAPSATAPTITVT